MAWQVCRRAQQHTAHGCEKCPMQSITIAVVAALHAPGRIVIRVQVV